MSDQKLNAKKEEIRRHYELMFEAVKKDIPEQYQQFLVPLERNVKFKWYGEEEWVNNLKTLYFTVAGRLQMAVDEHEPNSFYLTNFTNTSDESQVINTKIPAWAMPVVKDTPSEAITHTVIVPPRSTVALFASPLRGIFDGIAGIDPKKLSTETENKFGLEDAETSALGRALGKAGYGIVCSGFASADEMVRYLATGAEDQTIQAQKNPPAVERGSSEKKKDEKKYEFERSTMKKVTGLERYSEDQLKEMAKKDLSTAVKNLRTAMGLSAEHMKGIIYNIAGEKVDMRSVTSEILVAAYIDLAKLADWDG